MASMVDTCAEPPRSRSREALEEALRANSLALKIARVFLGFVGTPAMKALLAFTPSALRN
jgi:hypothetical protein